MTTITTQPQAAATLADGAPAATCRYPGCASPARVKDPAAPGPRPGYCEQEVPEDRGDGTPVLVRHTAMTAFRRRQQLAVAVSTPTGPTVLLLCGPAFSGAGVGVLL